jgi:NADPH2:quinone reductase
VIQKVQEHIWPLVAAKKIKPVIANTFPLEKAVWAHRLLESQLHFGKILLIADPDKVKADDAARPVENPSTCD